MPRKKYDEIVKLPADKLAQTMSDVTYLYKETTVPKTHYKKFLEEIMEEELDEIMTRNLLDVYVKTLKQIMNDSPRLFIKSLLCLEMKIIPTSMRPNEYQALELTVEDYLDNGKKYGNYLSEKILAKYKDIKENGILNEDNETDHNEEFFIYCRG